MTKMGKNCNVEFGRITKNTRQRQNTGSVGDPTALAVHQSCEDHQPNWPSGRAAGSHGAAKAQTPSPSQTSAMCLNVNFIWADLEDLTQTNKHDLVMGNTLRRNLRCRANTSAGGGVRTSTQVSPELFLVQLKQCRRLETHNLGGHRLPWLRKPALHICPMSLGCLAPLNLLPTLAMPKKPHQHAPDYQLE